MGKVVLSPKVTLRRFVYAIGTELCADVALNAKEAEEYGSALGDKNGWYWAGYADCATALAETSARLAEDETIEAVRQVIAEYDAERRAADSREGDAEETPGGEHIDPDGPGLWDHIESAFGEEKDGSDH